MTFPKDARTLPSQRLPEPHLKDSPCTKTITGTKSEKKQGKINIIRNLNDTYVLYKSRTVGRYGNPGVPVLFDVHNLPPPWLR